MMVMVNLQKIGPPGCTVRKKNLPARRVASMTTPFNIPQMSLGLDDGGGYFGGL